MIVDKVHVPKNICVVVSSLGKGGAERSSALLTKMLDMLGHRVFLVTMEDSIDYIFEGNFLNVGAWKPANDNFLFRFKRARLLRRYLREHKIDLVIDNRARNLFYRDVIFNKYVYKNIKKIYVIRSFKLATYFPRKKWKARFLYKNADALVGVSKGIVAHVKNTYGFEHVHLIYNPVENKGMTQSSDIPKPFIMTLGRLDDGVKNYRLLLDAYAETQLPALEIPLLILGSGKDRQMIKEKIASLKLEKMVMMQPFDPHPERHLEQAHFVTLTSRHEGFPRAIIEALAVGTPVVSVDCDSGPSEIIKDGENGLLVPNFDKAALVKAMNRMAQDQQLHLKCKQQAKNSVAHLSLENIAVFWQRLIQKVC
ncbi:glycosyltransferase [Sungkyunkwania multivorans]|uniref:Glycosyltransferase n=1 Tax=Sungkyunkwania multivorans TaxID=1173618 RepID=A0ABW3CU39_9FLAO